MAILQHGMPLRCEEVDMGEFEELLADDVSATAWDQELRLTTPISVISV